MLPLSDVHDGAPQALLHLAWCRCVGDRQDDSRRSLRAGESRLLAQCGTGHPPPPVDEEPIAEGVPVVPVQGAVASSVPSRRIMLERLVGILVDVVGMTANNRGRSCPRHSCCGSQVVERSTVVFRREQLVFRNQREEDVIAVYLISHGVMTCKVGFLPAHLNHRARNYVFRPLHQFGEAAEV